MSYLVAPSFHTAVVYLRAPQVGTGSFECTWKPTVARQAVDGTDKLKRELARKLASAKRLRVQWQNQIDSSSSQGRAVVQIERKGKSKGKGTQKDKEHAQRLQELNKIKRDGKLSDQLPRSSECNVSTLAFGAGWFVVVNAAMHWRKHSFAASTRSRAFCCDQGKPHGHWPERNCSGPRRER